MEIIRFIFWEAVKVLGLVFLGVVAAKSVRSLETPPVGQGASLWIDSGPCYPRCVVCRQRRRGTSLHG